MAIFHIAMENFFNQRAKVLIQNKTFSIRKIALGDIIGNIYAIVKKEGPGAQCVHVPVSVPLMF